MQQDQNHDIQNNCIYGPVSSRRFGKTLGVNLLPNNDKLCNFDCVYCQLGTNESFHHTHDKIFPNVDQIQQEMDVVIASLTPLQQSELTAIVISGNGEPTLYPYFIEACKLLSNYAHQLQCKLVLLSNGIGFKKPELWPALQYIDICCIKWDAAPHAVNQSENRPLTQQQLADMQAQTQLILQCCFLAGAINNTDAQHLESWIEDILHIQPSKVDIYTVSRAPAMTNVIPVSHKKLLNIKNKLLNKGYTNTRVFND